MHTFATLKLQGLHYVYTKYTFILPNNFLDQQFFSGTRLHKAIRFRGSQRDQASTEITLLQF